MTKWRSKVKEPCSSSITSANTIPTSVINSRVVLIVRLICHDEKVYQEIIFCKASQIEVNCIFLHKITGLAQNLPISNKQPFYQEEIKLIRFLPSFTFSFILIKLRQQK